MRANARRRRRARPTRYASFDSGGSRGRLDTRWERNASAAAAPEEYVPPEVTPGDVLSALERTGLPYLTVQTQPAGETLVNFDTIFYVDPQQVTVDLTILGQAVDVVATPAGYSWSFGDGSGLSTTTPGAPYPSKEITHRYADAHVTVEPSVTVSYTARFRVGGGAWQDIDGTVSSAGPGTPLLVSEATPLLTAGER